MTDERKYSRLVNAKSYALSKCYSNPVTGTVQSQVIHIGVPADWTLNWQLDQQQFTHSPKAVCLFMLRSCILQAMQQPNFYPEEVEKVSAGTDSRQRKRKKDGSTEHKCKKGRWQGGKRKNNINKIREVIEQFGEDQRGKLFTLFKRVNNRLLITLPSSTFRTKQTSHKKSSETCCYRTVQRLKACTCSDGTTQIHADQLARNSYKEEKAIMPRVSSETLHKKDAQLDISSTATA